MPTLGRTRGVKFCHLNDFCFLFFSVHGSQASLLSGGSSLYGSTEERQATEVRRLKLELATARDQVMSLSSQLSTNVSRFVYFKVKLRVVVASILKFFLQF